MNLFAQDAWFFYVPLADWLTDHRIGAALEPGFAPATDRIADFLPTGVRVGFEEILASTSALVGVSEGRG